VISAERRQRHVLEHARACGHPDEAAVGGRPERAGLFFNQAVDAIARRRELRVTS